MPLDDGKLPLRTDENPVGPLFNPALAFGQMVFSGDFNFIIQYFFCPFGGAAIALVFYEFVFVKSQEYLNEGEASSDGGNKELDLGDENTPERNKETKVESKDEEE